MLTIFRRHLKSCPQTSRDYRKCKCPLHVERGVKDSTLVLLRHVVKDFADWCDGRGFRRLSQGCRAGFDPRVGDEG